MSNDDYENRKRRERPQDALDGFFARQERFVGLVVVDAYWEAASIADKALSDCAKAVWSLFRRAVMSVRGRLAQPQSLPREVTKMLCRMTYSELAAFAAGRLDAENEARIRDHLDGCETCRLRSDSLSLADDVLSQMPPVLPPRREMETALAGAAFATLPPRQREVLAMHVFRRMSFSEIAQQLDVPEDKAASLVHRARANLARALEPVVANLDVDLLAVTADPPTAAAKRTAATGDEHSQGVVRI